MIPYMAANAIIIAEGPGKVKVKALIPVYSG